MNKFATLTATAALAAFGFTSPALAGVLSAPGNFSCNVTATDFELLWDEVDGAEKYAVDIVCFDADGEVTAEFSEGTSACSDPGSFLFTDEDCDISITTMTVPIDEVTVLGAISGDECIASVRGLHRRGPNHPTVHLPENDMCGALP